MALGDNNLSRWVSGASADHDDECAEYEQEDDENRHCPYEPLPHLFLSFLVQDTHGHHLVGGLSFNE
jgi:hypothetical protein